MTGTNLEPREREKSLPRDVAEVAVDGVADVARGLLWWLLRFSIVIGCLVGCVAAWLALDGFLVVAMNPLLMGAIAGLLCLWKRDVRDGIAAGTGVVGGAVALVLGVTEVAAPAMITLVVSWFITSLVLNWEAVEFVFDPAT